jgi:2,3-bisphosphoglycerate-dependent phosphoglycerate mutase
VAIQLVYETHAMTLDNERGRATGWLPGTLSQRGRERARQPGRRRAADGITAAFSSGLARAAQTAAEAFGQFPSPCCWTGGCANATTGSETGCR